MTSWYFTSQLYLQVHWVEYDHVDKCPPGLEASGQAIEEAEHTQDYRNKVERVIPVVYNDPSVVQVPLEVWQWSQVPID